MAAAARRMARNSLWHLGHLTWAPMPLSGTLPVLPQWGQESERGKAGLPVGRRLPDRRRESPRATGQTSRLIKSGRPDAPHCPAAPGVLQEKN